MSEIIVTPEAQALADSGYQTVVFYDPEVDAYIAYDPDLAGLRTQWETAQEARDNLNEHRPEWITLLLEDGLPIAEPGGNIRVEEGNGWSAMYITYDLEDAWRNYHEWYEEWKRDHE